MILAAYEYGDYNKPDASVRVELVKEAENLYRINRHTNGYGNCDLSLSRVFADFMSSCATLHEITNHIEKQGYLYLRNGLPIRPLSIDDFNIHGDLRVQLNEALEVIKFYGNSEVWQPTKTKCYWSTEIIHTDSDIINGWGVGGKLAREFLKKWGIE